jgi:5-formaminoimidazole-4-carboxamide-1-(beta)-D-ribofuranosyl 5'-monophosphate synthetase
LKNKEVDVKTIATLGSHCALQLLKSAKEEGFKTLVVSLKRRLSLYKRFKFIDEFLVVNEFAEVTKEENINKLNSKESILIPHGTLISEVGIERVEKELNVPIFGNRYILRWEADRELKDKLMKESRMITPRRFSSPEEINCLAIAKLPGAAGGRGYFLAYDKRSYDEALNRLKERGMIKQEEEKEIFIQEYVIGVPVYLQFFYSPLNNELELLGVDKRYETNVDVLGRIPARYQLAEEPSYMVVGNMPLVLRESLLNYVFEIGENFVKASKKLVPPGIIGPFCIEGVYKEDGTFVSFEFSARIVAGTNLFVNGSPYSYFYYDEPMSMGKRIAREIKAAKETSSLNLILT